MTEELRFGRQQLKAVEERLLRFAEQSPVRERELRQLLRTIPGVGFVTAEVVLAELAELADAARFTSQKKAVAYSEEGRRLRGSLAGPAGERRPERGIAPGEELHLEKNGAKLLRAALVEAAWRLVRHSPCWRGIYERLTARVKAKKAIVAVARRLLCLVTAILNSGQPYSPTYQPA